ncbi:hypothetical protein G4G27_14905 [Sphingomonas sp. So64.6b]|uniref:hypothetical protein n=1 Tax=Sphingomonas sp. So64.6b TaxID=2997354 RepID=UPI001601439E|nr:hypothetical protein [Sphingomonas sp. So64.6b]QNA85141.1 hypothetical protein G4G27_14905 [Sphingomonas sp. So64.6b]
MINRAKSRLVRLFPSPRLLLQIVEQSFATIAVQALGAITTLSFVHLLPQSEYALFGLCIVSLNFIVVSSDLGLGASMQFFWREAVRGGVAFPIRYRAILRLRIWFFGLSSLIGLSILGVMIARHGGTTATIATLLALVAVTGWLQVKSGMTVSLARLGMQLRHAYSAELMGSLARAALAGLGFFLLIRGAWFPLATMGATTLITIMIARRSVDPAVYRATNAQAEMKPVLGYVLSTMLGTIIFTTQDILVYSLASLHGSSQVIAQTFALGRLAAIFVVISGVMANVIIPRIANLSSDGHAIRNGLLPPAIVALGCAMLTALAAGFSDQTLLLLGSAYGGLRLELILALSAASLSLVAQMLGRFNRAMGWVKIETMVYLVHIVAIVGVGYFSSFTNTRAVLTFNLILSTFSFVEMLFITCVGLRTLRQRAKGEG